MDQDYHNERKAAALRRERPILYSITSLLFLQKLILFLGLLLFTLARKLTGNDCMSKNQIIQANTCGFEV